MTGAERQTTAGRVGRAHGRDGSFYVDEPQHPLEAGTSVTVADHSTEVEERSGRHDRPLVRLHGIGDRDAAAALHGEPLLVALGDAPLEEGEWLVEDLVGCRVEGLGEVRRVLAGPSCDVLEVGEEEVLVPFVSDAVRGVDVDARLIQVDLEFLGLDSQPGEDQAR